MTMLNLYKAAFSSGHSKNNNFLILKYPVSYDAGYFFHVCVKRNNLPYRSILIFFLNYLFFVFAFWVKRYYNERITNIRRRGYARRRGLSY